MSLKVNEDSCTGCSYCKFVCPSFAIDVVDGIAEIKRSKCERPQCGDYCARICPVEAITPIPSRAISKVPEQTDVIIVGAGIGGLLTGAILSKLGKEVTIFEKLPFVGGRYTSFNYKGYEIGSGAIMLPCGPYGCAGRICNYLNLDLKMSKAKEPALVFWKGKVRTLPTTTIHPGRFGPPISGLKVAPLIFKNLVLKDFELFTSPREIYRGRALLQRSTDEESLAFLVEKISEKESLSLLIDSATRLVTGLHSRELPARELYQIATDYLRFGYCGYPKDGLRRLPESLREFIERRGGRVLTEAKAESVEIKGKIVAVRLEDGQQVKTDLVISNAGIYETVALFKDEAKEIKNTLCSKKPKPIEFMSIKVGSTKPLIGRDGVCFTPECQRTAGMNDTSLIDSHTAPRGKFLLQTWQQIPSRRKDIAEEIRIGTSELRTLFPDFDSKAEILGQTIYQGKWPGTEIAQTFEWTYDKRIPFQVGSSNKLFLIGAPIQSRGCGIELIARGIVLFLRRHQKDLGIKFTLRDPLKPIFEIFIDKDKEPA